MFRAIKLRPTTNDLPVGEPNSAYLYRVPSVLLKTHTEEGVNSKSLVYSQSPAGNCSTAWRKTGSTFVYTMFVRSSEECSNNFCLTDVFNGCLFLKSVTYEELKVKY